MVWCVTLGVENTLGSPTNPRGPISADLSMSVNCSTIILLLDFAGGYGFWDCSSISRAAGKSGTDEVSNLLVPPFHAPFV